MIKSFCTFSSPCKYNSSLVVTVVIWREWLIDGMEMIVENALTRIGFSLPQYVIDIVLPRNSVPLKSCKQKGSNRNSSILHGLGRWFSEDQTRYFCLVIDSSRLHRCCYQVRFTFDEEGMKMILIIFSTYYQYSYNSQR